MPRGVTGSRYRARIRFRLAFALLLCVATACSSGTPKATPAATTSPSATPAATTLHASLAPWHLTAPRSRAAVVVADGKIFLLGGLIPPDASTPTVVSIDPATGTITHPGALAVAVHDVAGALIGSSPVVFGGGAATSVDTVQTFSSGHGTVTGHLPGARSDLATAVVSGRVYILGGFTGSSVPTLVRSTTDGRTFPSAGQLQTGVRYPAVAALGDSIWVIGGSTKVGESATGGETDAIQRFDTTTGQTTVVGHLPHPIAHASAFVLSGTLFVAGGASGGRATAEIWRIDPSGAATSAGTLPDARSDAAVAVIGDTAWLLGGEAGGPSAILDTVVAVRAS